jgi:uncharacterized protein (TIGR03435 family)
MERALVGVAIVALWSVGALGQSTPPSSAFEAADVHLRPPDPFMSARADSLMSGGLFPGGRYEAHQASMADLIRSAYDLPDYALYGGPSWVEMEHYEVIAKTAPRTSTADLKLMLQALLADRFKLKVHKADEPLDVNALTQGKQVSLKVSEAETGGGCKFNGSPGLVTLECRMMTLAEFVKNFGWAAGGDRPLVDLTELKNAYDFTLKWSPPTGGPGGIREADAPRVTFAEAVEKQLGLKVVEQKYPMPVLVVDSVNRTPTPNAPGIEKTLGVPTEFEAASVKPTKPGDPNRKFLLTKGRVEVENIPLRTLIGISRNLFPLVAIRQGFVASEHEGTFEHDMIAGGPKWLDTQFFDIVAKADDASQYTPGFLPDQVMVMLQALLAERFKLVTHTEQRTVPVFALVVGNGGPKLTPADPKSRSGCKPSSGEVRSGSDTIPVQIQTCHNVTMAQLAESLHAMARAFVDRAAVDMTGLKGGYDFTLTWTGIGVYNALNAKPAQTPATGGAVPEASDAHGISMSDALEKLGLKLESGRKAPQPVIVIDHVEPLTDN